MREIVFDTETTGLNPAGGDRMVEIGCIEIVNRVETGRTSTLISIPTATCRSKPRRCTACQHLFLSDKPRFSEKARRPARLHRGFAAGRAQRRASISASSTSSSSAAAGPRCRISRMVDTLALARSRHPGAKHSLDALCMRFGIDRSHRVKHGALLDAQLLAQVYVELTGGRQIGLGWSPKPARVIGPAVGRARSLFASRAPPRPHAPLAGGTGTASRVYCQARQSAVGTVRCRAG